MTSQPPPTQPYDLDDEVAFAECAARLKQAPTAENFVVRFDDLHAVCAIDVDQDEAIKWLDRQQGQQHQQQQHPSQGQDQQQQCQPRGGNQTVLWMNFWAAESQRDTIRAVAEKYDLSPRLAGLLCPARSSSQNNSTGGKRASASASGSSSSGEGLDKAGSGGTQTNHDVEKGLTHHQKQQQHPAPTQLLDRKPTGFAALKGLTFGDVVKDLWHFCSVDFGRHYSYVGFNALYSVPEGNDDGLRSEDDDNDDGRKAKSSFDREDEDDANDANDETRTTRNKSKSKPSGQRIWTSLLICDDGTVVSVFERPNTMEMTPELHAITSRNVLNVFCHLSRHHGQSTADGGGANAAQDALMKVRVRWTEQKQQQRSTTTTSPESNGTTINESNKKPYDTTEASSLLFYYLFDDWLSTYALIARLEHPYRERLEEMRRLMFQAADVRLIKQVHDVGRQLTVLKLMYQSYELIVSRLLHRARGGGGGGLGSSSGGWNPDLLSSSFATSAVPTSMSRIRLAQGDTAAARMARDHQQILHLQQQQAEEYGSLDHDYLNTSGGVKLSLSAVVRFERLLDRIRLYALTEIEECLKEKESLVLMNFNLVALKESQAVERLTRTTILLAKATILFLPVSLMTGYFSIQLPQIAEMYTLKTYWLCFLVVGLLSVLFLFVFGYTTHTLEGRTVYTSVTRSVGRMLLNATRRGKRKVH